ncbi:hypothetical protein AU198_21385 [Mycobacterium sp. GA-1199]|uniref:DUF421 domain-containing protein n=1 Tax=Mycobacterium sp. GA-1199 TaxID=1772287 RepID=UPI000749B775|nr:YetF domain-containing protein [Mycobacterium sp. GA-1199]KUI48511.1 hypothetical protein AU198_21385 [Mycobacterium sp. GA-1199]
MSDWQSFFVPAVPLLDGVLRGTVTFLALLVLMRIVGQRESGGLGITDVLIIVLVAEAAAPALYTDETTLIDSFVVIVTILFWSVAVDAIAYRFPLFARVVKAHPKPLIRDGKLNRHTMRREFMRRDEIESQLRLHGISDVEGVQRAYLEPNGMISVLRRDGAENGPVEKPEAL